MVAESHKKEEKSADCLAFEHYLRTGERLSAGQWSARYERKFNPYHDERGRFTFASGAVEMGSAPGDPAPTKPRATLPERRQTAAPSRLALPRTRIAAMPGYPEDKRTAWRSSNDAAFVAAANFYNRKYGLKPGDQGFRTAEFLKAWAMVESGGEGNESDFRSDPFQVNKPGDWPKDGSKQRIAGLRKGEIMNPAKSAYSALEWLRFKSQRFDAQGKVMGYRSDLEALQKYNGNSARTRKSGVLPNYVWYADTILQMVNQAPVVRK